MPRRCSGAFRRYGRRHDLINLGKVIVIACQLIFLVAQLRHRPLALFGACLADFSAILFLVSDWRTQRAIARLNFAAPSVEFLRSAIARLDAQRNPLRSARVLHRDGWCLGRLQSDVRQSLAAALFLPSCLPRSPFTSATPFAAYAFGRWLRGKRFEKECRPLIDRLESRAPND